MKAIFIALKKEEKKSLPAQCASLLFISYIDDCATTVKLN